jgi:hypothetical protein
VSRRSRLCTRYPVPRTPYPVPRIRYPVPGTRYPESISQTNPLPGIGLSCTMARYARLQETPNLESQHRPGGRDLFNDEELPPRGEIRPDGSNEGICCLSELEHRRRCRQGNRQGDGAIPQNLTRISVGTREPGRTSASARPAPCRCSGPLSAALSEKADSATPRPACCAATRSKLIRSSGYRVLGTGYQVPRTPYPVPRTPTTRRLAE